MEKDLDGKRKELKQSAKLESYGKVLERQVITNTLDSLIPEIVQEYDTSTIPANAKPASLKLMR